ncbi:hypothetical protein JOC37_000507 [Desulfohalotomaculum tongense]|uniref:hypothetical protein n=1 Tax=Desulforadius tongensis TaxID=1216062 RepID=UPI00195C4128|nr:hypothetical protein [Desulforadius tongensis]MBM7854135.1 hypothetical protein [Desulforadius tongensis]
MASKFIKFKKIIVPIMSTVIITSQLTGCAAVNSKEMINMIDSGQSIALEVSKPSYEVVIQGEPQGMLDWVQLDQLKTYNKGFRQGFDELFNINIVTENGVNGKNGCLFVDEEGDRNGNTTLEDALRNKVFVTKYWKNTEVKSKLVDLAEQIYTDIDGNTVYGITGAINAYYNLLENAVNPSAFNPTQSLSRDEFYALVFKSEEGVREIEIDKEFENAIGGPTEYSKYAQEVDEYGFLSVANKSLDATSYKGSISRVEAIYMMVNKHFPDELAKVKGTEKAFKDTRNGGDIALYLGFKYKDKKTKEIIAKDRWQAYTLATMLRNPDMKMQEELYKAMVAAKKLNLIPGEESRWDEPLNRAEAIQLIMNTHLAKNKLYGYLSDVEFGKMNIDQNTTDQTDDTTGQINTDEVLGETEDGRKYGDGWEEIPTSIVPADPNKKLKSGITLWEAKVLIKDNRENLKSLGYSEEDIKQVEEGLYRDLGTTAEEIARCPDRPQVPVTTQKPSQPKPEVEQPAQQPTQQPVVQQPAGSYLPPSIDKDRNGRVDAFEESEFKGENEGTESDPNFNLSTDFPEPNK